MLGLLAHIVLWVLAGIGLLAVIAVVTERPPRESAPIGRADPPPHDLDLIYQELFPQAFKATGYDATVRQLRRLERDAMQRLEDLRTGRP